MESKIERQTGGKRDRDRDITWINLGYEKRKRRTNEQQKQRKRETKKQEKND